MDPPVARPRLPRVPTIPSPTSFAPARRKSLDGRDGAAGAEERARKFIQYVHAVCPALTTEHAELLKELTEIRDGVDHIKAIVATQQAYATTAGLIESAPLQEIVEDAFRINTAAFNRHRITVVRKYEAITIRTDRHKVIQILVNLLRNAKYACDEGGAAEKKVQLTTAIKGDWALVIVTDNGVGIPPEHLEKIFQHGFTTRKDGHGLGLHSGALCAKELGGELIAQSGGPGQGATFTLRLPLNTGSQASDSP